MAATRLHAGHVSLARSAAHLARNGFSIQVFCPERSHASAVLLESAIRESFSDAACAIVVTDEAQRTFGATALAATTMAEIARVFGAESASRPAFVLDIAQMLSFFLHSTDTVAPASLALIDRNQLTHVALTIRVAHRLQLRVPGLLVRALVPSLAGTGRASIRHVDDTLFLADDADTIAAKLQRAMTGGRATLALHRSLGGEPQRCPVFSTALAAGVVGLEETERRCISGDLACRNCKVDLASSIMRRWTEIREYAKVCSSLS